MIKNCKVCNNVLTQDLYSNYNRHDCLNCSKHYMVKFSIDKDFVEVIIGINYRFEFWLEDKSTVISINDNKEEVTDLMHLNNLDLLNEENIDKMEEKVKLLLTFS